MDPDCQRQPAGAHDEKPSRIVLAPNEGLPVSNTGTQATPVTFAGKLQLGWKRFEKQLVVYNVEARGIQRVEPDERHDLRSLGYTQAAIMWFSINLAANNITLGMLGPAVFALGFGDACLCAILGVLVGPCLTYSRYIMGWWPSKLVVILNIIVLLGYAMIDCVVAGQILSAVSSNSMSVVVGIIIVAIIAWLITTFGYQVFHYYERYAWLPQIVVLCILAGVAGPNFNVSSVSHGDAATLAGNRLSFFGLNLAAAITYSGGAADYFVYYPEHTAGWKIFGVTMIGLMLSFTFAFVLGIGLASGMMANAAFCGVIVGLGLVANLVVPTYSSGIDAQILGRWAAVVPRAIWNTVGVVIYTVCALAGRGHLAEIFTNFLALMGYWVSIWVAIVLEEHFVFRRKTEYNWAVWNEKKKLPIGFAALIAFLVGWVFAIISMAQVWYIGPIAKLVGEYGGDMGNYLGFASAAVVYPPLRALELKKFGR
ncbi:hypothetical protein BDV95DRAFT_674873 [Massariosphaeria phaeospora]|uniref:Purine-cytosine permease FCY21 n=1 Tax=Massariosphaeria phaeospora TaxID=100035 RepID=A0A7C8MDR5_9PLEO|nr:hypothetical protein BDV95DRAFT_674873 [Massariosphaeria phaeospora]